MRAIFIAPLVGLGIGICAVSPRLRRRRRPALPTADGRRNSLGRFEQAYWRPYRHRHWWWRHHWHHRWW